MSTSPQLAEPVADPIASSPATHGGGPRTEEGKAISSKNAITHGLFAATDFIRPDERDAYNELSDALQDELVPLTVLEQNLVEEIRRAMWRLRRCGQIEQSFADAEFTADPMQQESTAKLQLSVDRARSLSHRLLHKCTAELRKLQTERLYRNEYFDAGTDLSYLGLADLAFVTKSIGDRAIAELRREKLDNTASLGAFFKAPMPPPPPEAQSSFCKTAQDASPAQPQTSRNAQCPCGSDLKHKRCCGKDAPALLHAA